MESKFHRWWLGSCVVALLLASWLGGFSFAVTTVFVVIYLAGDALIDPQEAPAEPADLTGDTRVAAEPDWQPADVPVEAGAATATATDISTGTLTDITTATDTATSAGTVTDIETAAAAAGDDNAPVVQTPADPPDVAEGFRSSTLVSSVQDPA
jgi:hypothetical protein